MAFFATKARPSFNGENRKYHVNTYKCGCYCHRKKIKFHWEKIKQKLELRSLESRWHTCAKCAYCVG